MSFNTVMVQLDLDDAAESQLEFASGLAQQFDADLIAFAAAEARMIVSAGDSGVLASEALRLQVKEIGEQLKVLEGVFQSATADNPRASWRGYLGDPTRLLALHARAADLIIVGPSTPGMLSDHNRTVDQGALILSAGRPILSASDNPVPIRHESVVIAWKDTREARRAVVDSMPFLTKAEHVLVLTIEDDEERAARDSADEVVLFLKKHSVRARSEVMDVGRSQACEALAQVAGEVGANLIVSGGYGHSRLREWALGGMTRSLLCETGIQPPDVELDVELKPISRKAWQIAYCASQLGALDEHRAVCSTGLAIVARAAGPLCSGRNIVRTDRSQRAASGEGSAIPGTLVVHGGNGDLDAVFIERFLYHHECASPYAELGIRLGHQLHPEDDREVAETVDALHLQGL